ncbi:MAG: hypothetical protein Q8P05_00765 [Candidatus Diapherotrites archaeon]|nr:hypothetical protein [Candidatus Diapherotrites archaeon]
MKTMLAIGMIALIVLAGCVGGSTAHPQTPAFTAFAQCITDSDTLMYGSFTCLSCKKQREEFGPAFEKIIEIECHPNGENPQVELCLEKNIAKTPTWVREVDGQELGRIEGLATYQELEELTGCPYPGTGA